MANDTADLTKYQSFLTEGDIGYQDPYLGLADPGIKYDPRDQKYASDLYSYYLTGIGVPPVDEAGFMTQDTGTADQGTGEGGGGAAITAAGLPITEDLAAEQDVTADAGFYDPPITDYSDVTTAMAPPSILNPEQSESENIARAQAATDPRYVADVAPTMVAGVPMQGRQNVTGDITDYFDLAAEQDVTADAGFSDADALNLLNRAATEYDMAGFSDPMSAGADYIPELATPVTGIIGPAGIEPTIADAEYRDPIMDMVAADQGVTADAGFSDADIQTAQSPESMNLLDKIRSGAATAQEYISKYGMAAYNFAKGNILGAAGSILGGPMALASVLDIQKTQVSPEQKAANAAFEQANNINVGSDGRITDGPLEGLNPAGKSFAGSATYEEMVNDKIADIKNRKAPQTKASEEKIQELEELVGNTTTRDLAIATGIEAADEEPSPTPTPTPRAPDFVTGGGDGGGVGSYSGPGSQGVSGDVQQSGLGRQDADTMSGGSGNGGSGGGGKIVCTMMNDSYGFGSFRNKIWLRQSKNLAPEYQIGYHKIFLPLVKLSKKNIVLKKILEHIAVHRTIDIRQESRGKTHMLGRIYRKILEPICYWAGKNG